MVPGSRLLWLRSSPSPTKKPPTPPQQHLHPYSQQPAPCHIRLPESPLLPSLFVTQLGKGDQASWGEGQGLNNGYSISYQERPAVRLEAILLCL